jgi:hypothetical protein
MTFDEVLAQVQELLQREKRVSYRALKRRSVSMTTTGSVANFLDHTE